MVGLDELTIEINSIGTKRWIKNGRKHRTDGPAIEYANGNRGWYLDGVEFTEEQFNSPSCREFTKYLG